MLSKQTMVEREAALEGRARPMPVTEAHFVNQSDLKAGPAEEQEEILLGMGCFWGAERLFWQLDGVVSTSVGYSGGYTPNPSYEEVCSGQTGHAEVVRVIFQPSAVSLEQLLQHFWEKHDPTQGMRQGHDQGTQYRSAIYTFSPEQQAIAEQSKTLYQQALKSRTDDAITTEICRATDFYFAETHHQQYLARHPGGYCGLGGTGVCFPPQQ
jgi:peptide-methionine (S)-S-oxide reductase